MKNNNAFFNKHPTQPTRNSQEDPEKHPFQKDFCQTYEEAFKWKFGYYIRIMERFADYLGREKLLELIKRAVDEQNIRSASDNPDHTFARFVEYGKKAYQNMLVYEIIEESDNIFEMNVSDCLWAKTFHDKNAADIGYATVCHGDFTEASAYHPKLKLERTKTLMQGHECCNHRWTWEE